MKKPFDDILEECIRRLETGGGDVEDVIREYPEHRDELRAHLEVWASLAAVERPQATQEGATRGRLQLLIALARANRSGGRRSIFESLAAKGGLSVRYAAMFVAGAVAVIAVTLLSGNLEFGGDGSTAEAQPLPECLTTLDFNGDGELTVEDVMLFRDAIESQDPAFDFNEDGVVDVFDVVNVVQEVVTCFQQQQPPGP